MKTFATSSSKNIFSLHYDFFNWITPGQSTNSCLQLLGIFIMIQESGFKQIIVIRWLGEA